MTDSDANASSSLIQNEKSRTPLQFCKRLSWVSFLLMQGWNQEGLTALAGVGPSSFSVGRVVD